MREESTKSPLHISHEHYSPSIVAAVTVNLIHHPLPTLHNLILVTLTVVRVSGEVSVIDQEVMVRV